jgi:prolyl-tRNA synthetase
VPVAPFEVAVVNLKAGDEATDAAALDVKARLEAAGVDVLYDDTDERAGAKFATMDLIGIPYQVIVGPKGVKAGEIEIKDRKTGARETLPIEVGLERTIRSVIDQRVLA